MAARVSRPALPPSRSLTRRASSGPGRGCSRIEHLVTPPLCQLLVPGRRHQAYRRGAPRRSAATRCPAWPTPRSSPTGARRPRPVNGHSAGGLVP
ncbi:hypothetical protein HBB16_01010 [Pseudonocardia sp. MCCB 268]|nr:hypothetical protein [Pseudonocardia cytotoxica]